MKSSSPSKSNLVKRNELSSDDREILDMIGKQEQNAGKFETDENGVVNTGIVELDGKKIDISSMRLKDLKEDQRVNLLKFQNQLLESQWVNRSQVDKYWRDSKRDIFEIRDYPVRLRDNFRDEWDDIAYLIKRGRIANIKVELKQMKGFHPKSRFRDNGDSILHVLAEFNQIELFKWVVSEFDADVNIQNNAGETPFIIAAREGKFDVIKYYIESFLIHQKTSGAKDGDKNEKPEKVSRNAGRREVSKENETSMSQAMQGVGVGGFKVDHKMLDGWTALMYAAMNGFASIVDYLVNQGHADVNAVDRLYRNSLHWACRFNNIKVAQKLMSLGIKYDAKDIESQSPIDIAQRYQNFQIETLVEQFDKNKRQDVMRKRKLKMQKDKQNQDQVDGGAAPTDKKPRQPSKDKRK
mmetsp:Transcript_10960/g.18329  ORF Transcript_10960/g.18329 Transcript_10960/m.18329 type:complete len:410 (-) Transcript_10960:37-1266(-)